MEPFSQPEIYGFATHAMYNLDKCYLQTLERLKPEIKNDDFNLLLTNVKTINSSCWGILLPLASFFIFWL